MSSNAAGRISSLRQQMKQYKIDLYVVPNSDYHGSEYIGEYFKAIKYLTGFTGSAATVVVTEKSAYLWTDGRYFIQAAKQLEGSGITLMRTGEEGVPKVKEFIEDFLKEGSCIGFDGRTLDAKTGEMYQNIAKEKGAILLDSEDFVGKIWKDRPQMPKEPFFLLEECYSGKSTKEKLAEIRKAMQRAGADTHILSSLTDIAWILNMRGSDISHVPVVISYLVISKKDCRWFVQKECIAKGQRAYFEENGITICPYEDMDSYVESLCACSVLYQPDMVNYRIAAKLSDSIVKITQKNPSVSLKAVKNPIEITNTIRAHIKDGVAFTKFMYWLKTHIGKETITELSASEYLEERRKEQEHFLENSFETICAYGANAAMMHYQTVPDDYAVLQQEGFLLVDSGGHYLEGTTDITRTIALGTLTEKMKEHFTAVLRANLNLSAAKFLYGCSGQNLDILAREPLWQLGLDYKCGTGHGVGHILNVHEGPNAFRWKKGQNGEDTAVLEEGMITTDEPGIYLEGEYGIRIENELLCRKAEKNEYGQFMQFETITYAPIDLDAVNVKELTDREKKLLNSYHQNVYRVLSFYLTDEEKDWLKEYTRAI